MAASSARTQKPIGSTAWVASEKENIMQLIEQEMEEIEYPVRHELVWLNEHMAEIFSQDQFNFADVFKTPGKLRRKTPRTLKKRSADESRVPLSEIFSTSQNQVEPQLNPSFVAQQSSANHANTKNNQTNPNLLKRLQNAQTNDAFLHYPSIAQNLNSFSTHNTDSGYHGVTGREAVVLAQTQQEALDSTQPEDEDATPVAPKAEHPSLDRRTTEASFHSAKEEIQPRDDAAYAMDLGSKHKVTSPPTPSKAQTGNQGPSLGRKHAPDVDQKMKEGIDKRVEDFQKTATVPTAPTLEAHTTEPVDVDMADGVDDVPLENLDDIGSPSVGSTPERPFIRKSSLNFASLPAREPLTTKKSMGGARISRTSHVELAKHNAGGRTSYFAQVGGPRKTQNAAEDDVAQTATEDTMNIDNDMDVSRPEFNTNAASLLHNMSSTQRLTEKITMLGKLQSSRPTKSIPAVHGPQPASQVMYPDLPVSAASDGNAFEKNWETSIPEPRTTEKAHGNTSDSSSVFKTEVRKQTVSNSFAPESSSSRPGGVLDRDRFFLDKTQNDAGLGMGKSSVPAQSSPRPVSHQKSASVSTMAGESSPTPIGSPKRYEGPLSASKSKLQSIMKSAKGLFTSSANISYAAKGGDVPSSSPSRPQSSRGQQEVSSVYIPSSPPKQEVRKTRSSSEKDERRRQQEHEDRRREEERQERLNEEERQKIAKLKAQQEKEAADADERAARAASAVAAVAAPTASATSPKKAPPQTQRHVSKEPEFAHESEVKKASSRPSTQPVTKTNDRRPIKPTREPVQKPKPQPVSIRVGSALSRQMPPLNSAPFVSSMQDSNPVVVQPPQSASKQPSLKKKASNTSLHTTSSASSLKNSGLGQSQRKAQLATERKREQEEKDARKKEEQRRELERKRAIQQQQQQQQQQQEELRRQELRSRAEIERRERDRERLAGEESKKTAQMQAIEKRRLENARRLEKQTGQPPANELSSILQSEKPSLQQGQRSDLGANRPPSRLGSSMQTFGRSINHPAPNPAKPPKRAMEDEASQRPPLLKPSSAQPASESKRRKTEDESLPQPPVRPTMAPPIRQSNIRKEPVKPSAFGSSSVHAQTGTSNSAIFKPSSGASNSQPQRLANPMDMAKFTTGKIPFAETASSVAVAALSSQKGAAPGAGAQRAAAASSPKYPNSDSIHLPEIPTDSEDEDSDAEMFPVPEWAEPKQLEERLRLQDTMEADRIFGPVAPFSLEETFKADKKIKKYRERTSSANWSGADGLTQDEIRRDIAERQRLRLNGGWTFGT